MIHQLEALAKVVLREPSAALKKSTGGEWVLRINNDVGPIADFSGAQREALAILYRYHTGTNKCFFF
jgi:hypothetical protein